MSDSNGKLFGFVSIEDYRRALNGEFGPIDKLIVRDIVTRDLVTVYPDDTLGTALRRMAPRDLSRLPVVARDDPRQVLGVIWRSDAVRAYDVALSRRAAMQHRVHQVRPGAFVASGVGAEEITVETGAPCEGKCVSEVAWPRGCVIATLRRGRQVFNPHGNTVLKVGDMLAVVVEGEAREAVRRFRGRIVERQRRSVIPTSIYRQRMRGRVILDKVYNETITEIDARRLNSIE